MNFDFWRPIEVNSGSSFGGGLERPSKDNCSIGVMLGTFDGLHKGHQFLAEALSNGLERITKETGKDKYYSILASFYPHPRSVLLKSRSESNNDSNQQIQEKTNSYSSLITPARVRAWRVEDMGMDELLLIQFTRALSNLSPRDFIKQILVDPLSPSLIVVGYDWRFGRKREGDVELLEKLGQEYGFKTIIVDEVKDGNLKIGARRIRELLSEGQIKELNYLLNYPFSICGKVVHGDGRGKLIGVPTANIHTVRQALPRRGVYKTKVSLNGELYQSITNVGVRPSFIDSGNKITVETHLLDYSGDLYGKRLRLEFHEWVREERKFLSVDELKTQIAKDIEQVRE